MNRITASLVLFNTREDDFAPCIDSFLDGTPEGILIVVDNSPVPIQSQLFSRARIKYIYSGKNLGFGAGHNIAFRQLGHSSTYHLILNPDIRFEQSVIPRLAAHLDDHRTVVLAGPRIVYPDGQYQGLCKLLPTPWDLIIRRFVPIPKLQTMMSNRYQLKGLRHDKPLTIPSLSGCFLFVRTSILQALGGFDERYFMYMEDVDLVRRFADHGQAMYLPDIEVKHGYGKGSYRNLRLLSYHIKSAIKYFNKWGWFFDRTRRLRNSATLKSIKDI